LDKVLSVAVEESRGVVATAGKDKMVRLYSLSTFHLLSLLSGHTQKVNSVDFSSSGLLLASGSEDFTIRIWSVEN
jgi:WD40 repeat protein